MRTTHGLYPGDVANERHGSFVADIYLSDFIDRGVDHYRPDAMHPEVGDAVVSIMVDAPATIRRLLARIDELEDRLAKYERLTSRSD